MSHGMKHVLVKYLFRELWVYFLIAFLFFFLIFFVNHLLLRAEEILEKRVPVNQVALFLIYSLPFVIAQSAPFATLVGFLMCLGRMVSDNEILILRSTGHSFSFLVIPVVITGLIISLLSFAVNDYLLPLGTIQYNKLYLSILVSNPAVELEPHSIKRFDNSTVIIGDVQGQKLSDIMLFETDSDGRQRIVVASDVDVVPPIYDDTVMQLDMGNAAMVSLDTKQKSNFDFLTSTNASMNMHQSAFLPTYVATNPAEMTFYDLKDVIDVLKSDEKTDKQLINMYDLEFHKKFSIPFGSIFFAILAFPLSVSFGKQHGQTIGLIIGIIICVFYWALMILGQQFSLRNGFNSILTTWFPNLLTAFFAFIFYIRVIKK